MMDEPGRMRAAARGRGASGWLLATAVALWLAATAAIPAAEAQSAVGVSAAASSAERLDELFRGEQPETIAELRDMQARLQELSERLAAVTVAVRIGPAHGSGVIISPDGLVLTAAHVAGQPGRDATLTLHDDREVRGRTLGMNRNLDAGLIQIIDPSPDDADGRWDHAEMAEAGPLLPGQWCLAMGHPGGHEGGRKPVVRIGRVLSYSDSVIVTDCTLIGGDSGGPLFDTNGHVIGIHSRISGPLTSNMHVPITAYHDAWERMVAREAWGQLPGQGQQPFLGVQGNAQSDRAVITEVFRGTPAERAGIRAGDIIVRFDGKDVTDFASLSALVKDATPGERVVVELLRGGRRESVDVVIGQLGG